MEDRLQRAQDRAERLQGKVQAAQWERDEARAERDSLRRRLSYYRGVPDQLASETRWLARILYSETNRPKEMRLVAWSVRNRVQNCHRGHCTYEATAQSNSQYSALQPWHPDYHRAMHPSGALWEKAVEVAHAVRYAPEALRPFSRQVMHFVSPHALASYPDWVRHGREVVAVGPEGRRYFSRTPTVMDHNRFSFLELPTGQPHS